MVIDVDALVHALGWTLLHSLWQGLAIVLVYVPLARLPSFHLPSRRLFLGHIALLALVLWPGLTLATLLQGVPEQHPVDALASEMFSSANAVDLAPISPAGWDVTSMLPAMVAFWAFGVVLLSLRAALRWMALQQLCRRASTPRQDWNPVLGLWQSRLAVGLRVRVLETTDVAVPIVVGVLRPLIFLPAGLCLRLSPAQLELIIAHELAHVRRWDTLANALQVLVETVLFHHPAVHWLSRRVREDRELCCDDLVAAHGGDPLDYARALLVAAETQRASLPSHLVLAATGGVLLRRIERIVAQPGTIRRPASAEWSRLLPLIVTGALLIALTQTVKRSTEWLEALPTSAPEIAALPQQMALTLPVVRDVAGQVIQRPSLRLEPAEAWVEAPSSIRREPVALEAFNLDLRARIETPAWDSVIPRVHGNPVLIERVLPDYPRLALLRGIDGTVDLSYRVGLDGRPFDIRVESASPAGIFDGAATNALRRWRFQPIERSSAPQRQAFAFSLPDGQTRRGNCEAPTGTRICRAAN